jgi:hypothetical protein
MTIGITGAPEPSASDPPNVLQQGGIQTQDRASDTTVLITEAEVALGTAAAMGCATEGPSVGCAAEPDLRARAEGITPEATAEARPDTAPLSTRGEERPMLNAALGMLPMVPVVFGVAGFAMVSR